MGVKNSRLVSIQESIEEGLLEKELSFQPDDGRILLFDQRMLLMHGFSLATLRREIIERIGMSKTRELFTRTGYQQGVADARHVQTRHGGDMTHTMALGPRVREIEGFVRNHAHERMQFNTETGEFWGDYLWTDSWEAEAHKEDFGVGGASACWMMTGYACGFTTTLMGRPILWHETECVAMGHEQCRVIGRPLEDCDNAEDDLRFLQVEDFISAPKQRPTARHAVEEGSPPSSQVLPDLVGASSAFNKVAYLLKRVAPTRSTVLISGESGVGKERFSRALHAIGPRETKPFVSVNCAAIPDDLVEAELFGVKQGAFTGAQASRIGRFERAHEGTLFLDEISSLPLSAQGKLLRAIQEGEVERVGGAKVRQVDVRIVAASNCDLRAEVEEGRFREDLFYRLNVFPIRIPPLRERLEDIPLLLNLFIDRYARQMGKQVPGVTQAAVEAMRQYHWPGNVRELENMVERAVILIDDGASLDVQQMFSGGEVRRPKKSSKSLEIESFEALSKTAHSADHLDVLLADAPSLKQLESDILRRTLELSDGNVSAAARRLGMLRGQFNYRWKKLK